MMLTGPSFLLSVVALVAACGAARAEDLPVTGSTGVDLSQALCSVYGTGFHAIPGTDTCLRVGGSVRVDSGYVGGDLDSDEPNFGSAARGRARFESRTPTDLGEIRIVIDRDFVLDSADR